MISSAAIAGPLDSSAEEWLRSQALDEDLAACFAELPHTSDLSDDRSAVLAFLYVDALESDLADARWPDESAMWSALRWLDPAGWIVRLAGVDTGLPPIRADVDSVQVTRVIHMARAADGVHPLRTLAHCGNAKVFEFGPHGDEVRNCLDQLRPLPHYEPDVLEAIVGDVDAEIARLRASLAAVLPGVDARISLVYRARGGLDLVGRAAALAAALGDMSHPVVSLWPELLKLHKEPDDALRSPLYRVPTGHPVNLPSDAELGPEAAALRAFYTRSGSLSRDEIVRLVEAWSEKPWRSRAYDRARDIGRSHRPLAYAIARGLGALGLPERARLAIKDAAGAIVLRDILEAKDFEVLIEAWNSTVGGESDH